MAQATQTDMVTTQMAQSLLHSRRFWLERDPLLSLVIDVAKVGADALVTPAITDGVGAVTSGTIEMSAAVAAPASIRVDKRNSVEAEGLLPAFESIEAPVVVVRLTVMAPPMPKF